MPRLKTGRRALIATLTEIMTSSQSSIEQKLEACKILAGLQLKPKTDQPKKEGKKEPSSKLLG
jgi:hypothetical protein